MKESDEHAYDRLFATEYPRVMRAAFLVTGDRDAAQEVAQDAFGQLFIHWRKVKGYDRPGAWVRRVAIRRAVKQRERGRKVTVASREFIDLTEPAQNDVPRDLDLIDALGHLSAQQRAAVVLHYYEDQPVRDVAATLRCSEATAKVHLHRGRTRLAGILQGASSDVL
jgi:RNA polymerase sigma-70 factor (ECF subfamily)